MNADVGRQQTTRGLWLAPCENTSTLVMDVEGTDSKERGELHMNFERKSALFSLALSEVLIVNMWANDVGRYQASNYGLLKNVLDLHIQLFQTEGCRTLLLFILRDHSKKMTTAEKLTESLKNDMHNIWNDLVKPEKFQNTQVTDFFDLEFVVLPHKEYEEAEFLRRVEDLKVRFYDKSPSGILKAEYHKKVPADGFPAYASKIWETIMSNKEVDIPSHREMLASYRCEEISDEVYMEASAKLGEWKSTVSFGKLLQSFGENSERLLETTLEKYDIPASRYIPVIRDRKRNVLRSRLIADAQQIFSTQLENLTNISLADFKQSVKSFKALSSFVAAEKFKSVINETKTNITNNFTSVARDSCMPSANWSFEDSLESLASTLQEDTLTLRAATVTAMLEGFKEELNATFGVAISSFINESKDSIWETIQASYQTHMGDIKSTKLRACIEGLSATESEIAQWSTAIDKIGREIIREKIIDSLRFLQLRMVKRFESAFKFDENRVPRDWNEKLDITQLFMDARKKGEVLLDLFTYIKLDENYASDPEALILTPDRISEIKDQYESDIQPIFKDALEAQRRYSTYGGIPIWVFLVIGFLGFNEFVTVLTNPIYLFACLFGGVGYFILVKSGQQDAVGIVASAILGQVQAALGNVRGGAGGGGAVAHNSGSSSSSSSMPPRRASEMNFSSKPKED